MLLYLEYQMMLFKTLLSNADWSGGIDVKIIFYLDII